MGPFGIDRNVMSCVIESKSSAEKLEIIHDLQAGDKYECGSSMTKNSTAHRTALIVWYDRLRGKTQMDMFEG